MPEPVEQSPTKTVHVHDEPVRPEGRPVRSRHAEMLHVHLMLQVGPLSQTFYDAFPDLIHLEFCPVPPGPGRPWWTLVTNGMSAAPMCVREPGRPERLAWAELCMLLPPDWPFFDRSADEKHWPLTMLGELARLPHLYDSWLGYGHTVQNGCPPEPFDPACPYVGAAIVPPTLPGPGFTKFRVDRRVVVEMLAVVPLLPDELEFARGLSSPRFAAHLADRGVNELLEPDRPSVVPAGDP